MSEYDTNTQAITEAFKAFAAKIKEKDDTLDADIDTMLDALSQLETTVTNQQQQITDLTNRVTALEGP